MRKSESRGTASPSGAPSAGTPGPALSYAALIMCVTGAFIGYRVIWPVGLVMIIASLAAGIAAICRRSRGRWAAIAAVALGIAAIAFVVVTIAALVHQQQQISELLGA